MICGLFDLQFMISDDTWETQKLNKIDKDTLGFFDIIGHIDTAMHEELIGSVSK